MLSTFDFACGSPEAIDAYAVYSDNFCSQGETFAAFYEKFSAYSRCSTATDPQECKFMLEYYLHALLIALMFLDPDLFSVVARYFRQFARLSHP